MPELPTYVEKQGTDGRRYYKVEFMERLGNDLREGKMTTTEAHKQFGVPMTLLRRWKLGNVQRVRHGTAKRAAETKPRGTTAGTTKRLANGRHTSELLTRATNYELQRNHDPGHRWLITPEHVELAIAYCQGKVSRNAVNYALRTKPTEQKIMTTTWLGAVLKWALENGYALKEGN